MIELLGNVVVVDLVCFVALAVQQIDRRDTCRCASVCVKAGVFLFSYNLSVYIISFFTNMHIFVYLML